MMGTITQLHEHDRLISAAQTVSGQFGVWIAGITLLLWHDVNILMLASFTLVLLVPHRRRELLMVAAIGAVIGIFLRRQQLDSIHMLVSPGLADPSQWSHFFLQTTAAMLFLVVAIFAAIRFDRMPAIVRRLPVLTVHVAVWLALALSSLPRLSMLTWASFMAWRLSYLFKSASRGRCSSTTFKDHLFYLVPVYGGTHIPYGKGFDYLTDHEALDLDAIARSQMAGIKLLILAIVWTTALHLMDSGFYGHTSTFVDPLLGGWTFELPRMTQLMHLETQPTIPIAWMSIYLELIRTTLELAVMGHVIVGCLRLLGFNVFRNTYKPLLAESVVEFWNRFYFYFKELLVEFFFYPTFLRCTWAGPRLRLFCAVFAAAFVGNVYYHLLTQPQLIIRLDFEMLWVQWGPRLVYCLLLSLGIWVSMLRQQRQRGSFGSTDTLKRVRAIAGVWTFYGLIQVWNITPGEIGFAPRFEFLTALIGL